MPKRIPDETKETIGRLYSEGHSLSDIAEQIGVSYVSVWGMTKNRQRINPETGKPFESLGELQEYNARQRINPETGKPFESKRQYEEYNARQRINPETGKPFESLGELKEYNARQRINPETGKPFESKRQYEEYNARQRINPETGKPFESLGELKEYNARQRSEQRKNRDLSDLIRRRLRWTGLNQSMLAEQVGVSRQAISRYIRGKEFPRKEILEKIFRVLEVKNKKTLEELLNGEE